MLILAGVTISIVVNGGLFKQAQTAVNKTAEVQANEQAQINDVIDQMNNYANGGGTGGSTNNPNIPADLQIGDYVNYTPTPGTYTALASDTGAPADQTFTTEQDTKWRVLDKTGSNIVLVSETPLNANDGYRNGGLTLTGATGYNNAETVMNSMCNTLYSSANGTARSMTFADVAKVTGWDTVPRDEEWNTYEGYNYQAWTDETYSYTNAYNPEINNGTTQTDFTEKNTGDEFWLESDNTIQLIDANSQPSATIIAMIFGENIELQYWLASRSVEASDDGADFNVGGVNRGTAYNASNALFNSVGRSQSCSEAVRPVVTLNSNVPLTKTGTVNGFPAWSIK